jgi:ATP-dependent DNA ligase
VAVRSTTPSWTCPRRIRQATRHNPAARLKINGELVIVVDGRLSFDALQRRLVTAPTKARDVVASTSAGYVAFDLLAAGGVDLRTQRWSTRRDRLERLAASWAPYPD